MYVRVCLSYQLALTQDANGVECAFYQDVLPRGYILQYPLDLYQGSEGPDKSV